MHTIMAQHTCVYILLYIIYIQDYIYSNPFQNRILLSGHKVMRLNLKRKIVASTHLITKMVPPQSILAYGISDNLAYLFLLYLVFCTVSLHYL